MPVKACTKDGNPGWKWGDAGTCYTYPADDEKASGVAKNKAYKQGAAITGGKMTEAVEGIGFVTHVVTLWGYREWSDHDEFFETETSEADKKPQEKPGGSNVGKYKGVKKFCGPSGGAPAGSFPVNTKKRAIAALSYAHNAPNPAGIRACVKRSWPDLPAFQKGKKK